MDGRNCSKLSIKTVEQRPGTLLTLLIDDFQTVTLSKYFCNFCNSHRSRWKSSETSEIFDTILLILSMFLFPVGLFMVSYIKHGFPGQNFSHTKEYSSLISKGKFCTDENFKFQFYSSKPESHNNFLSWKVVKIKNKACWWKLVIYFSFLVYWCISVIWVTAGILPNILQKLFPDVVLVSL